MKWFRNLSVVLVVVMALTMVAGVASAQGPDESRQLGSRGHGFALVMALAEAADVPVQEIVAAWETDMTLGDVAASFDMDIEALVAEITAATEERLQVAVDAGRLTQEEADEILATLPDTLEEALAQTRPELPERPNLDDGQRPDGFGRGQRPGNSGSRDFGPGQFPSFGGNAPAGALNGAA